MKKIKNILVYSSSLFLRKAETKNIIKYLSQKCSTVDTHLIEDKKRLNPITSMILSYLLVATEYFCQLQNMLIKIQHQFWVLNFGRIGFLADLDKKDLKVKIKNVIDGNYIIDKRTLLSGTVIAKNKKVKSISLNDIVVNNRGILKMIDMNIYVNNNLITKQRSDGVIISTPTGSTAYAMSNGCPIVSPNSNVICIVPIAPHSYGQRSVIINNTDNVSIRLNNKSVNNSQVTFDGANNLTIENPTSIEIKKANKQLMIVHPNDYDYFKALSKN